MSSRMEPCVYLDALALSNCSPAAPQAAERVARIKELYNKRWWHEFSVEVLNGLVEEEALARASYDLHECLLVTARHDISPMVYVKILYYTVAATQDAVLTPADAGRSDGYNALLGGGSGVEVRPVHPGPAAYVQRLKPRGAATSYRSSESTSAKLQPT